MTRLQKYLYNKSLRETTLSKRIGKTWCRLVNGKWMTEKKFQKVYPLSFQPTGKQIQNPDKRAAALV